MAEDGKDTKTQVFAKGFYKASHPQAKYGGDNWIYQTSREILKGVDLEYVGNGRECVVVKYKGDERFVTAFRYLDMDRDQARETFYVMRIVSTLFPHNFPRFRSTFMTDHENKTQGGSNRQQIIEPEVRPEANYPFWKAKKALKNIGVNAFFETADFNYMRGLDGGQYYVDSPQMIYEGWDKQKALEYMKTTPDQDGKAYSNSDIKIVESSFDRLFALDRYKQGVDRLEKIKNQS